MDETPGKKYIPITEDMLDHSVKERYERINFEKGMNRCPRFSIAMALVLAAVFAVELFSALLPPVRDAFRGFPVTIAILVVGTVGLLLVLAVRRPRH